MNRPLSSAYADTFPATVGFFALFSLRRKSEKRESKDKAADARHFPKRGSRECGLVIKRLFDEKMLECCSAAPHHLASQGASPQGEALERERNLNRPLSSAYADTFHATVGFFALFSLRRKSEKGESKDKAADARHFPKRGKQECGLSIKRLFDEKMPECCSVAPHHLASQEASPQGEAYEID